MSIKTTEKSYAKWVKGRQDQLDSLVMRDVGHTDANRAQLEDSPSTENFPESLSHERIYLLIRLRGVNPVVLGIHTDTLHGCRSFWHKSCRAPEDA